MSAGSRGTSPPPAEGVASDNANTFAVELRWRDLDGLGHVNYASYLTLLEHGRDSWLRHHLGIAGGTGYVVVHAQVEYRSELTLSDGPVQVRIKPLRIGTTSLVLSEQIWSSENTLTTVAEVTIVMWDATQACGRRITADERRILRSLESRRAPSLDAT